MKKYRDLLASLLFRVNIESSENDIEKYILLLDELLHWNKSVNVTAITDSEEAIEKHIVDSLTLRFLVKGSRCLLDIGSGPGFPSLPLKIACPELIIYSVEASRKKGHFQRNMVRKLGLKGFHVVHCRAEDLKKTVPDLPKFDVIVSRALGSLKDFLKLSLPYLADSGRVIAMKGPGWEKELEVAGSPGRLILNEVHSLELPASRAVRNLLVFKMDEKEKPS